MLRNEATGLWTSPFAVNEIPRLRAQNDTFFVAVN